MSGRLVSIVFDSALPAWLKPYAAAFASFAADDGTRVYPTVPRVAKMVGRSERATQRAILELRRRGVLTETHPPGHYQATRYVFDVGKLPYVGQQSLFPVARRPQSGVPVPLVASTHGCRTRHPMGVVHVTRSVTDPSANTKKELIRKKGQRTTLSEWELERLDRHQQAVDEQIAAARKRESA